MLRSAGSGMPSQIAGAHVGPGELGDKQPLQPGHPRQGANPPLGQRREPQRRGEERDRFDCRASGRRRRVAVGKLHGQQAPHREPDDRQARRARRLRGHPRPQLAQGRIGTRQPVGVAAGRKLAQAAVVPGEQRHRDVVAALVQHLGQNVQLVGRAGEAVYQQHPARLLRVRGEPPRRGGRRLDAPGRSGRRDLRPREGR
jgi:hypothetical protein